MNLQLQTSLRLLPVEHPSRLMVPAKPNQGARMVEQQRVVLRLERDMIPELRVQFREAVDLVSTALTELKRNGYLASPWLGDEVSSAVASHYMRRALDESDSSYQALLAYRDELTRVHDTLQRMEAEYLRADGRAAANLQRRS